MTKNVRIERKSNEPALSTLRRFTRRVQGSGVLKKVRSIRYKERSLSDFVKKKKTLKSIRNQEKMEKLIKLGKVEDKRVSRK